MYPENRLEYITNKITTSKYVSVEKLGQALNVSGETIRRDLKLLEEKGILKRTHGGAYLEGSTQSDVSIQVRKNILLANKEQIAVLCSRFVQPDDTVFLDSSTTSFEIAKNITQMPITVITHSLPIISYLSNYRNIRLMALGGVLDHVNMCFTGKIALESMLDLYARRGFVSCRTVSMRYGVMDSNEQIGQIRSAALKNCNKRYLIADHTKFGNTSMHKIAGLDSYDVIVTDKRLSDKWMEYFEQCEIPVHYPEGVTYSKTPLDPDNTDESL